MGGNSAINGPSGTASFNVQITLSDGRPAGYLTYYDFNTNTFVSRTKLRSLIINGDTATVSGVAGLEHGGGKVTFTAVLTDSSTDGTTDTFSISLSNGYTASRTLTVGNILIQ